MSDHATKKDLEDAIGPVSKRLVTLQDVPSKLGELDENVVSLNKKVGRLRMLFVAPALAIVAAWVVAGVMLYCVWQVEESYDSGGCKTTVQSPGRSIELITLQCVTVISIFASATVVSVAALKRDW